MLDLVAVTAFFATHYAEPVLQVGLLWWAFQATRKRGQPKTVPGMLL